MGRRIHNRGARMGPRTLQLVCAFLQVLVVGFSLSTAAGAAPAPVVLESGGRSYPLGKHAEYLEDASAQLSLQDVVAPVNAARFRESHHATPNFGFTTSSYWLRFTIRNEAGARDSWFLHLAYPLLDEIALYQIDADGQLRQQLGGRLAAERRKTAHLKGSLFELEIPRGETHVFYLRTRTENSLLIPVTLWDAQSFVKYTDLVQYLTGLYYGIILAMLVYNLLLYLSVKRAIYLYYVAYLFFFGAFLFCANGYASYFFDAESAWWNTRAIAILVALAALAAIQFTRALLEAGRHFLFWNRLLKGLMVACALVAASAFVLEYRIALQAATILGLAVSGALLIFGTECWIRGIPTARFYVVAWAMFLFGCMTFALMAYAIVPANVVTEYSMQIGSALEVLLLSFALAYRIKLLEDENERINFEATRNLERRVAERTEELNAALADLSSANKRLSELNQRDKLTGVRNRAYFDVTLRSEWRSALRGDYPLALLVLDIDHFKQINDKHGHLCGDEVLRGIAAVVQGTLARSTDELIRYGGEEFVILLPHTDSEGAAMVAERIRREVAGTRIEFNGSHVNVRVSIGVAAIRPSAGDNPADLIASADAALYAAKDEGRDRVSIFCGTSPLR